MTTKNPEALENLETPETKQELRTLETQITWDRRKFETLSKSSILKRWMEKIMKKWLEGRIKTFEENHNKYTKESVDYYTESMVKKHPELINFIVWDLKLPVRTNDSWIKIKFSQLSFEQKLNFMALMESSWDYTGDWYKKAKVSEIIDKYWKYMWDFTKEVTDKFNNSIDKNKNFLWLVNLEGVLKNDYWLTDSEYKKMKEYLDLIQKHPEYVWWRMKPQEAWNGLWYLIVAWLSILLWVMWTLYFQNVWRVKPTERVMYWDRTEIVDFREVFQVMSAYAKTDSHRRQFEEDGIGEFDETTWTWIEKAGKTVWNVFIDAANTVQRRKLDLQLKTEIWYFFDAETATCSVERKNWKWIFHIKLKKKPELKIISEKAQVLNSRREWINMDKFDDFELRCIEDLKKEAMEEANKPEEIKKAENSFKKNLLSIFKNTWFANSQMVIEGKNVEDVVIEYEN